LAWSVTLLVLWLVEPSIHNLEKLLPTNHTFGNAQKVLTQQTYLSYQLPAMLKTEVCIQKFAAIS